MRFFTGVNRSLNRLTGWNEPVYRLLTTGYAYVPVIRFFDLKKWHRYTGRFLKNETG